MVPQSALDEAFSGKRRWCYYISGTHKYEGSYVPSMVVEGVRGHYPMLGNGSCATPWVWGDTLEEAEESCRVQNHKRGLSDDDVSAIVLSSMKGPG
jgi:hypothetical protein